MQLNAIFPTRDIGTDSAKIRDWAQAARDLAKFGIEGWLRIHAPDPQRWAAAADGWRRLGSDMVMLYPMYRIAKFED